MCLYYSLADRKPQTLACDRSLAGVVTYPRELREQPGQLIGELALENDFLESALTKAGLPGARR